MNLDNLTFFEWNFLVASCSNSVNRHTIVGSQTTTICPGDKTNSRGWNYEKYARSDFTAILGWRRCTLGTRLYKSNQIHAIFVSSTFPFFFIMVKWKKNTYFVFISTIGWLTLFPYWNGDWSELAHLAGKNQFFGGIFCLF